jgi:hypothetical protein
MYQAPSASFEASMGPTTTGLTGTIGVLIDDGVSTISVVRTTVGITEYPTGSGIYRVVLTAPASAGQYRILWDDGGTPARYSEEDLDVISSTTVNVVSGSFTYDPTTVLGQVRLEVGDTDSTDILFTDQEANVYISTRANDVLLSAADLCDVLATRFSRGFDFETDQQKFSRSQRVKQYQERAVALRKRAAGITSTPSTRVDGYSQDIANDDASTSAASSSTGRVRSGYFNDDVPF